MNSIFDENFGYDDVLGISNLDELEDMEEDLRCGIDNIEEQADRYNANANIIRDRIGEIEDDISQSD